MTKEQHKIRAKIWDKVITDTHLRIQENAQRIADGMSSDQLAIMTRIQADDVSWLKTALDYYGRHAAHLDDEPAQIAA